MVAVARKNVLRGWSTGRSVVRRTLCFPQFILTKLGKLTGGVPLRELPQRVNLAIWSRTAPLRPLLLAEPSKLSVPEQAAKALLTRYLSLPDARFRRGFDRIEGLVASAQMASNELRPRDGVLMVIGTLGAGGSERQLVATAKALHVGRSEPVRVTCLHLDCAAQRFFLPNLEAVGIATSIVGDEGDTNVPQEVRKFFQRLPAALRDVSRYAATLCAKPPKFAHF
jgi:hypothetical protein